MPIKYGVLLVCILACFGTSPSLAEAASSLVYQYGDHGPKISIVQSRLAEQGYYQGKSDGYFSLKLLYAVKAFQKQNGLTQDGRIDECTYWTIIKKPNSSYNNREQQTRISPNPTAAELIKTAKSLLGIPYRYGGAGLKGFDCSGYTEYVFRQHGRLLPRTADKQYTAGIKVLALEPADLVFFETDAKGPSHCGIYLGQGQFIHASTSRGVMISRLDEDYWKARYLGARRVLKSI